MYIPVVTGRSNEKATVPGWLKLEQGETLIRRWGRGCGERNTRATIIASIITALATLFAAEIGEFDFQLFRSDISQGPQGWILISLVLLAVVMMLVIAVSLKMKRRSTLQAVLTDRRMLFRERGRVTQFMLRDISRLRPAGGNGEQLVQFQLRRQRKPVASLPVDDPQATIAEISRVAEAAGAQLG